METENEKTLSNVTQLDTHKKSRQQIREEERQTAKELEKRKKFLNEFVPRHEIMALFKNIDALKQRLFQAELNNAALERIMVDKKIATRDEVTKAFEVEAIRSKEFNAITSESGNYVNRIFKCAEFEIDVNVTNIPDQLYNDESLTFEDKLKLAVDHNITRLLEMYPDSEEKIKAMEVKEESPLVIFPEEKKLILL